MGLLIEGLILAALGLYAVWAVRRILLRRRKARARGGCDSCAGCDSCSGGSGCAGGGNSCTSTQGPGSPQ